MLRLQNSILEMIARGESLEATTHRLCRQIEKMLPGIWCSVLRVDRSGLLHPLAGSSFPDSYLAMLDGLMTGPLVGACGSAAYLAEPVAATDIATDPRWEGFRDHVLALGLHACWSSPICDATGAVLGTFALYFPESRGPSAQEQEVVASCTALCAIALERHQKVVERERGAYVDALTDLPNRASLDIALERLSCTQPGAWAILIVDLDNLKAINDTFGHAIGDSLLQKVAARIATSVAPDRVFRMGGDEFAVILHSTESGRVPDDVASSILNDLRRTVDCSGHVILPRATIGGAVLSSAHSQAAQVLQHADFALYHAKENAPGSFVRYWHGMGTAIESRIEVIRDVDAALRAGRVDAFYQPILRLDTRAIVGVEALCRLRKPDGEILPAAAFQEATSDVAVASHLTEQMMARVAMDVRSWLEQGIAIQHVGLNIASADFHSGTLFQRLEGAFGRMGVPLKHIVLEVTESVYLGRRDPVVAKEIMELRNHGLRIALDDFGTGFASLTHLLNVPVDVIKIDKSFIDTLVDGGPSLAIVEGLVNIARKLGIRVVAEGIEDEAQADLLGQIGCELGQGFLFSQAVSRHIATDLLSRFAQPSNTGDAAKSAVRRAI
ncbi:EAL domain-containing protein [Mesorhizobium sp. CU2]|uniref:sensor domain-containing phosphodiesterase n=1 Tax=unclassified Mesorhizobium TaxID=325217 RepID=UPI00112C8337|nr:MULTISPECIES: EAL domain-containing protein [unclassified Mesorhizobium]TPN86546.1 EAL domain-containing protein [Mesorhizobium sp. CU3]TPO14423.1 EAL domain-containing protein [Mesorhizobium sp. CU2]